MKRTGLVAHGVAAALAILVSGPCARAGDNKWQANVPSLAQDSATWILLTENLLRNRMYYGALASARRMTVYFTDLPTKEAAYRTIVNLVDQGFPLSVRDAFITGDLEPGAGSPPDFVSSYYLYKAMLSQEKKVNKWAQYYFAKIDRENFPKYLFFSALEAYSKGDINSAAELLKKFLSKDLGETQVPLMIKASRTLARIYFEQGNYEKSLEIYRTFLLKLNPITPGDWLEAAWNFYHLKRYDEALGVLYNLESKAGGDEINLEKYSVRALIYRQVCSQDNMQALVNSFNRNFGSLVEGIKHGEPLTSYPVLKVVKLPENVAYNQALTSLMNLNAEAPRASQLPKGQAALAVYLYRTEIQMLGRKILNSTPTALSAVANQLLMISEQLRFLKFDIERSKFNPESVFKPENEVTSGKPLREDDGSSTFSLLWPQIGDFWIDERNSYKAALVNRCFE